MPGEHLDRGYIRNYRSQFDADDALWRRSEIKSEWEAWQYLLSLARWETEPEERTVHGVQVIIHRGELVISQRALGAALGWGRQAVRGFLALLQRLERITAMPLTSNPAATQQQPSSQPTGQPTEYRYKVCNYDTYNPAIAASNPASNLSDFTTPPEKQPNYKKELRIKNKQPEDVQEKTHVLSSPAIPDCPTAEIITAWNALAEAHGLPHVKTVTSERQRSLHARWTSPFWRDHWRATLDAIPRSPWCMGQNDRGWRANFDWFLRPNTVPRLMEDFYGGCEANQTGRSAGHVPGAEGDRGLFDDLARADRERHELATRKLGSAEPPGGGEARDARASDPF